MKHKPQRMNPNQIQDNVNELLDRDRVFERNYRALRNALTTGIINSRMFNAIRSWQIGAAIRRAGLPLTVTRAYLRLAPTGCV